MKRKVTALAASILAAGVASAFALAPSSQSTRVGTELASAEPKPAPAPTIGKPTLEARQAPVPILFKPRTPVEPPRKVAAATPPEPPKAVDPAGGATANDTTASTAGGAPGNDTPGGSAAKAAVEADGYKAVKVLRKGDNGLWYAEGLRGRTKVILTVDAQGNVTTE